MMAGKKKGTEADYVVLYGCVQHNGKRYVKGSVITLTVSAAERLVAGGVLKPLSEVKGETP